MRILILILFILMVSQVTVAQISMTSTDILSVIGKSFEVEVDFSGNVAVNLGSAGENQTWDFSAALTEPSDILFSYISPDGTPFAAEFPQANFVELSEFSEEDTLVSSFTYHEVSSSFIKVLGIGFENILPGIDTSLAIESDTDETPLPLTYNTQWTHVERDTVVIDTNVLFISADSTVSTVDAWGTVILPGGSYDCLRIRDDVIDMSWTVISGQVLFADTTTAINYSWISKETLLVASAESFEDETDPNYTQAGAFGRLKADVSSISDRNVSRKDARYFLGQNYPNPFNPDTHIKYELKQKSHVRIEVYDLRGQLVQVLVDEPKTAGKYRARWNGKNIYNRTVASGIYYYILKLGPNEVVSKRMILLR